MDDLLSIDLYPVPPDWNNAWNNWLKDNTNANDRFGTERLREDWGANLNYRTGCLEFVDLEHRMEWLIAWS